MATGSGSVRVHDTLTTPGGIAELRQCLQNVLGEADTARAQAELKLGAMRDANPDAFFASLACILRNGPAPPPPTPLPCLSTEPAPTSSTTPLQVSVVDTKALPVNNNDDTPEQAVRELAAVLLRKYISRTGGAWDKCRAAAAVVRTALLEVLQGERHAGVRRKAIDAISALAGRLLPRNEWPEFLPMMAKAYQSGHDVHQCSVLHLLEGLTTPDVLPVLRPHVVALVGMYRSALSDTRHPPLQLAAVRAQCAYMQLLSPETDAKELSLWMPTVPLLFHGLAHICKTLSDTATNATTARDDEWVTDALRPLLALACGHARTFRPILADIGTLLVSVVSDASWEASTRRLALELLLTLLEQESGTARNLTVFSTDLVRAVLALVVRGSSSPSSSCSSVPPAAAAAPVAVVQKVVQKVAGDPAARSGADTPMEGVGEGHRSDEKRPDDQKRPANAKESTDSGEEDDDDDDDEDDDDETENLDDVRHIGRVAILRLAQGLEPPRFLSVVLPWMQQALSTTTTDERLHEAAFVVLTEMAELRQVEPLLVAVLAHPATRPGWTSGARSWATRAAAARCLTHVLAYASVKTSARWASFWTTHFSRIAEFYVGGLWTAPPSSASGPSPNRARGAREGARGLAGLAQIAPAALLVSTAPLLCPALLTHLSALPRVTRSSRATSVAQVEIWTLRAVAELATVLQSTFAPWYTACMSLLARRLLNEDAASPAPVGRCSGVYVAMSRVGQAVGGRRFAADAKQLLEQMLAPHKSPAHAPGSVAAARTSTDEDDEYWDTVLRLATVMQSAFGPFLPRIVSALLPSLESGQTSVKVSRSTGDDGTVVQTREDGFQSFEIRTGAGEIHTVSVHPGVAQHQITVCQTVGRLATTMGAAFAPHASRAARALVPLVSRRTYDDQLQMAAVGALVALSQSVRAHGRSAGSTSDSMYQAERPISTAAMESGSASPPARLVQTSPTSTRHTFLKQLWAAAAPGLVEVCGGIGDTEATLACQKLEAVDAAVGEMALVEHESSAADARPLFTAEQVKALHAAFTSHLTGVARRRLQRAKSRAASVAATDAAEGSDEADDLLVSYLYSVHSRLVRTGKEGYGSLFHQHQMAAPWVALLAPGTTPARSSERTSALCVLDELVEHGGPPVRGLATPLYAAALAACRDADPDVRQAAACGVGVCAVAVGAAFDRHVPEAVERLLEIVEHKRAREEDWASATDNALASLAKLMYHFLPSSSLGSRSPSVEPASTRVLYAQLGRFLAWLPCSGADEEASQTLYHYVARLVDRPELLGALLGPDVVHLPRLARVALAVRHLAYVPAAHQQQLLNAVHQQCKTLSAARREQLASSHEHAGGWTPGERDVVRRALV